MEREILKAALAPGEACLSTERLGQYADGALGAGEQAAAAHHVRECLNCRAELALLRAVMSGEAEVVPAPSRRGFGLSRVPFAAVAAVLVVAAGAFYARTAQAPSLPRDVTTGNEVTRSLSVSVRGPVGEQAETPRRFEWLAVDGAARYRVRLMEVDRHEIWTSDTKALEVELPAATRSSLALARTLLWDVTAYDAAGAVLAESGAQSFSIMRR